MNGPPGRRAGQTRSAATSRNDFSNVVAKLWAADRAQAALRVREAGLGQRETGG